MSFARVARQGARSLRTLGHNERTIASTRTAALASARLTQPFSTSPAHLKKRKPDTPSKSSTPAASSSSGKNKSSPSSSSSGEFDPLDLDPVSAAFAESDAHFQTQVQTVLHGGRFNPSHLGALPVTLKSADSTTTETFPLRELAQVVPRAGRTVSLLINEKAYVKPIMSAVQTSSDFNQQPQRSDDNELELLLRVEAERPEEVVRRVREATQAWRERVRQARTRHEKLLKEARKSGALLPDALKKVEKEVQKLQDKKIKEIDALEAQSVKQVGRH
ncbi:ribosomal recycling factor [Beauveria bassiana ARSEF 2860]|uniref:Ribosomal recycling factor n=1 Tax=Beauveria bassiana (strain ARSEF 2860) TaxID=655819 RepID=J5K983_BEAB2|nr:ribosomal recycling factor [Beauveria bassiana ARSEF 2860]EJP70701.1 ribosomal recycling factor [Beauveria bassiana ARSEF 2860]